MDRPTFAIFRLPFVVIIAALTFAMASCITPSEFDQKIPNDTGSADQTSKDGTSDVTTPDVDQDGPDLSGDEVDGTTADGEVADDDTDTNEDAETVEDLDLTADVEVVTCDETLCGTDCVDLQTDSNHCGACDTACGLHSTCASGGCVCGSGWGNCNSSGGMDADGCETELNTADHCNSCDPGANCDIYGIARVCTANPGGGGTCALACADGYFDLDDDLSAASSNGCETGFIELGTATLWPTGQEVIESTVDTVTGQIFVATVDAANSVHVFAIGFDPISGEPKIDGQSVSNLNAQGGEIEGLAAHGNIVILTMNNSVIGYEYASATLTEFTHFTLNGVNSVAASPNLLADTIAEFVVSNGQVQWYVVLTPDDANAAGFSCETSTSTVLKLCTVTSTTALPAVTQLGVARVGGKQLVITLGPSELTELLLNLSKTMTSIGVDYDEVAGSLAGANDFLVNSQGTFIAAKGTEIASFLYAVNATPAVVRGGYRALDIGTTGTDLALLDSQRVAVATVNGVQIVSVRATESSSAPLPTGTSQAVAVSNNQLFVFAANGETTVYDLDLH